MGFTVYLNLPLATPPAFYFESHPTANKELGHFLLCLFLLSDHLPVLVIKPPPPSSVLPVSVQL